MNNNITIHYYSERGLVNRLIEWLHHAEFDSLKNFFELLKQDIKADSKIDIFNEFSFGQFGSPDLIIKVDDNVYIIEAKIDTFANSATKLDHTKFKDNASKINIQLLLRKRFINCALLGFEGEIKEKEKDSNDFPIYQNCRALKKSSLLSVLKDLISDKYTYYYVALVKKSEEDEYIFKHYFNDANLKKYNFTEDKFMVLTWDKIDETIGKEVLEETWKYTKKEMK